MWKKKNEKINTLKDYFLSNMEVGSLDEINEWFKKHYAHAYRIDKLEEAVSFVKTFINSPVKIVGDYDADGITSTSILFTALTEAGFTNVSYRIPKRFSEGFGINDTIVDETESGLIITCDNGLAQTAVINKAIDKGLSVVILDHHLPEVNSNETVISRADYVIDPSAFIGTADFSDYCGAGLCYKFAEILLGDEKKQVLKQLLSLAAIGTVADVVNLREENYVFVRNGLKNLLIPGNNLPGVNALLEETHLSYDISEKDLGFTIAPIINASSRMNDDGAKDVVELFISKDMDFAKSAAKRLKDINESRKTAKKEALFKAEEIIKDNGLENDFPLVVYVPETVEGVIGIVAGDLMQKYKVPTFVLTDAESDGILKGSARTYGNYNIKEILDKLSDHLTNYGGHAEAAGLSMKEDAFSKFREDIITLSKEYHTEDVSDDNYYDLEIDVSMVGDTIDEMSKYAPFGAGNPSPIFKVTNFDCDMSDKKLLGADSSTVKLTCKSKPVSALGFKMGERLSFMENKEMNITFFGTLSNNIFRYTVTRQITFVDFETT